jgi:WD40 repeat protein
VRRYLPILITLVVVTLGAYFVIKQKKETTSTEDLPQKKSSSLGSFTKQKGCAVPPKFLKQMKIPQPVIIDLSQKQFKGVALHYGKNFSQTLHPKQWEQYEHFGTYAVDTQGNIYLVPNPFISISPTTFNLQKNIYKLDSKTGKISIFMHFDDVHPSANNPYGLSSIAYDCDDGTLWVASIDESGYQSQKGVIYHVDPQTKEILQKLEGFDALSITLLKSQKGKFLLLGSARDNGLYAYPIIKNKLENMPTKLISLPNANEHIRKIKIIDKNTLELQSIPFSYTLIAQTAKKDRTYYQLTWNKEKNIWTLKTKE